MGFLDNLFGKKPAADRQAEKTAKADKAEKKDFSAVLEIARLISSDDKAVTDRLGYCLERPKEYFAECAARYRERGIDVNSRDEDTLYWIGMVDELSESGYLFGVDWKCELEDFLWALEQIKTYPLISDVIPTVELSEDDDVSAWGEEINKALGGKAFVCAVDIDSDSYELIIVTAEVLEKIAALAGVMGHSIEDL